MKAESDINIIIADDHQLFRQGIASLLKSNKRFGFIKDVSNGKELLDYLEKSPTPFHVVLLDLEMPVVKGQEAAKEILEKYPDIKILVLSMYDNERLILQMIELGVHGYLIKNTSPTEVENAIITAVESGYYFNHYVSRIMRKGIVNRKNGKAITHGTEVSFTEREMEVLHLICREFTASEIAEKLFLSPRTVEGYKKNLLSKAGVRNTAGLIIYSIKNRLIDFV